MKSTGFYIFFATVLTIYFLVNGYIVLRGWQALSPSRTGWCRIVFLIAMTFLILAYPAGRLLERFLHRDFAVLLVHVGAYYLAMMVFAFFLLLILDLFRLGDALLHYFPDTWRGSGSRVGWVTFLGVSGVVIALTLIGAWNARHPRIKELTVAIPKASHSLDKLDVVLVSDLQLSSISCSSWLKKIVMMINRLEPDVILLAGDVVDEDVSTLIEQQIVETLSQLRSRYGVYAVPGNHEYYVGVDEVTAYLRRAGITVLRDSVVWVGESFYLVGRDDRTREQFGGTRKSIAQLLQGVDRKYPIILMDHQPLHLEEAQRNGVDLQVSGHTHHGQLIPFNWITDWVYELSWGYLRKGNTHYYVSCGVGTWGPPVRLGSVPEIVKIRLTLKPALKWKE